MEAKEPIAAGYSATNPVLPHLRHYIMDRVESETDVSVLEQIYAIISPQEASFKERFSRAKAQTDEYCAPDLAEELEAECYMINKPYPLENDSLDIDAIIQADELDENAPQEWLEKMFPEVYA